MTTLLNLLLTSTLAAAFVFSVHGGSSDDPRVTRTTTVATKDKLSGPFSTHFLTWLETNGYAGYDFSYSDSLGPQASYGGRPDTPTVNSTSNSKRPVIFIHGNSDGALAFGDHESQQGWSTAIEHFQTVGGYSSAELYALTYGDRELANALTRRMECHTLLRVRRFIEAVLAYRADSPLVDIVAHSMGVSLVRRAIRGGTVTEMNVIGGGQSSCYLGSPLTHRVHTLIGIAGANYGMCLCANPALSPPNNPAAEVPACGRYNGFWAGVPHGNAMGSTSCDEGEVARLIERCSATDDSDTTSQPIHNSGQCQPSYSTFLRELNEGQKEKEARQVVSIWSTGDAILGPSNSTFGQPTSVIPGSDRVVKYEQLSHHELKTRIASDLLAIIGSESAATDFLKRVVQL